MSRARRCISITLTVLSLLLLLGIAALWVDSYWAADVAGIYGEGKDFGDSTPIYMYQGPEIISFKGRIHFQEVGVAFDQGDGKRIFHRYQRPQVDSTTVPDPPWWLGGFYFQRSPTRSVSIFIPHWFFILLFAIKPTRFLISWRRRRGSVAGHPLCDQCGYDLYGVTGDCPECGVESAAKTEATKA